MLKVVISLVLCLPALDSAASVGQVSFFLAGCPDGWAELNGATIAVSGVEYSSYSVLLSEINSRCNSEYQWSGSFDTCDGYTNKKWPVAWWVNTAGGNANYLLPDLRGEFLRGFDFGRGVDYRVYGSTQADGFQGHWHETYKKYGNPGSATRGIALITADGTTYGADYVWAAEAISDGTHGVPRVFSETRSRNVALSVCVQISSSTEGGGGDVNIVSVSTSAAATIWPGAMRNFTGGDFSFFFGLFLGWVILMGFKMGRSKF